MKSFLLILSLLVSQAFASSGEVREFSFDGSQATYNLNLKGLKTHTEYRQEQVRDTCYRTVFVGYRTVCTGGYGPGPGYPRRPGNPGRYCTQQPVYRQQAYSCMRTVTIPYEVVDYATDAYVTLNMSLPAGMRVNEKFTVRLEGEDLTLTARGSKKVVIVKTTEDISGNLQGNLKVINARYEVDMVDAQALIGALDMSRAYITGEVLDFDLGPKALEFSIKHQLKVSKAPRVGSDTLLLDRILSQNDFSVNTNMSSTLYSVDMSLLGINFQNGRYRISIESSFAPEGLILNADQFVDQLSSRKVIIYSL